MLKTILGKIGLTEGESQVYLALLELGQSSTGNITKKADIASSKVYEVLQRLMKKGLAGYVIKNGVKHYGATPPERLLDFLEEKKNEILIEQEEIKKILPKLKIKRNGAETENSVVVYTGFQGPKIVLKEILESGKRGGENYGFGTNEDDYVRYFPAQLNDFIKESKELKIKSKLIFAEGFRSPNYTAQIKYLPSQFFFPVRTMIYGNKVAIVDFTEPITTVIIEKKEIAEAYKNHFRLLWEIAKIPHQNQEYQKNK